MVSPNRRAVLASVGGTLLPLAGCLGTASTDTPAAARTTAKGSQAAVAVDVDPGSLSLGMTDVRKMIIADRGPWADLKTGGGQFLVLDLIKPDGGSLMDTYGFDYELPLAVELDGERFGPDAVPVVDVEPHRDPTDPESIDDHLAGLPIPTGQVDAGSVIWVGSEGNFRWELPPDVFQLMADAPTFEIRSFEPQPTGAGGFELDLSVANSGDRDGVWLAQVSIQAANDISDVFGYSIPAGETIHRTVRPRVLAAGFVSGTVTIQFWSSTSYERTFTAETSTPTSS